MAQSSIITGQYVELTQTPASVGDRLFAAIIDYVILIVYFIAISLFGINILDGFYYTNDVITIACYVAITFPVIFYYPFCEIFAKGQSIGKMAMKTSWEWCSSPLASIVNAWEISQRVPLS